MLDEGASEVVGAVKGESRTFSRDRGGAVSRGVRLAVCSCSRVVGNI